MKILDDVTNFFRKIFSKKENVKLIDSRIIAKSETDREVFLENIKTNIEKKKKVETYIWNGNGLGIQSKLNY